MKKTILIVDDCHDITKLISIFLEKTYDVLLAHNADEVFKILESKCPDLILLDVALPGMNGFEICSEIRSNSNFHGIPIIFVSTQAEDRNQVMAYKLGADDYIAKPFTEAKLRAVVDSKLKRIEVNNEGPSIIALGHLIYELQTNKVTINEIEINLTPKEREILKYLLISKGKFIKRESIIQKVWPTGNSVTNRAVDNHISNLRKKIEMAKIDIVSQMNNGYKIILSSNG